MGIGSRLGLDGVLNLNKWMVSLIWKQNFERDIGRSESEFSEFCYSGPGAFQRLWSGNSMFGDLGASHIADRRALQRTPRTGAHRPLPNLICSRMKSAVSGATSRQ
jgi:hypothetical protein